MMGRALSLPRPLIDEAVRVALLEDLGRAGDITTLATVPEDAAALAVLAARRPGVIAGLPLVEAVFEALDPRVRVDPRCSDGDAAHAGDILAEISGPARAILTGERAALNFLGHLSGIATATRALVDAVAGTHARVTCTRKTTPGLRALEKYAVRCGGGSNHRFGLDDAILIKDNHISVSGGVAAALARAQAFAGHLVSIEVEVDTLDQLHEALAAGARVILLDNMPPAILREAVAITAGRAVLEASGTVTLPTIRDIAETGVDFISSGWITHSAPVLDLGLDISVA